MRRSSGREGGTDGGYDLAVMSFDAMTTTDEVLDGVDLSGRTAVVTGASGGIGLETARALASRGATVVIAAREPGKVAAAATLIVAEHPAAAVESVALDLTSLASIRAAAAELSERFPAIDLLINNAGVMCTPFGHTTDGFELQFGTNHLGHFLFTDLLTPALRRAADRPDTSEGSVRVVNLSSAGHAIAPVDFDDPHFERRPYDGWLSYGQSKTANVLFSVGLEQRLGDAGIRAFAVHPGRIRTDLGRYMSPDDVQAMLDRAKAAASASGSAAAAPASGTTPAGMGFKTIPQGAATTAWAATSTSLGERGGLYLENCSIAAVRDPAAGSLGTGVMPWAVDPESAERLWSMSEQAVTG